MSTPPDRAIVFDIETREHPDAFANLGFENKLHQANTVPDADLEKLAKRDGIKVPSNYKKSDAIRRFIVDHYDKASKKIALKLFGSVIYAIGMAELDGGEVTVWAVGGGKTDDLHVWHRDERDVLEAFVHEIRDCSPVMLCGFAIRSFDLARVRVRCAMLGVELPRWFPVDERADRYDRRNIFDACDVLSEGTLDQWLRMADCSVKSASGADVADMTVDEVRQYCADDVACERELIRKLAPNVPALEDLYISTPQTESKPWN